MVDIHLNDFLSSHNSQENLIRIATEPDVVYLEQGRNAQFLNFDFVLEGLTERKLILKFIKVAVYDAQNLLLTYQYRNHNAVGFPGIRTIGNLEVKGPQTVDIPNPFFQFPSEMKVHHLRYMFTWMDLESKEEFYYGNVVVEPVIYQQKTELHVPLEGLMTILDGHDYYSHHRRFEMSIVREFTGGKFNSNFSRYGLDFVLIGPDGNLSDLRKGEHQKNYDFHHQNVKQFYTHETPVYAPAEGRIAKVVNDLDDLYESPFNMGASVQADSIEEIAGNYVVIQHNSHEFSHIFHLLKGSVCVSVGDIVKSGQMAGKVGFSGAATTYSHLHYQLMDGPDFLNDQALPCRFSDVTLIENGKSKHYQETTLDTSDFILQK